MMAHSLESARQKVTRGREHLDQLEREAEAFVEADTYRFADYVDQETGDWVVTLNAGDALEAPARFGLIAGDAVQNFRAALDHMVWQLAFLGTGPGEQNQFPILDSRPKFIRHRNRYLRGLLPVHEARIEGLQPYYALPAARHLRLLARLSNVDKHRIIIAARRTMLSPDVKITGSVARAVVTPAAQGAANHGTEVVRISDRISSGEVQVDVGPILTLVFGDLSYGGSIGNLIMIADAVTEILDLFEGEFISEPLG